MNTGNEHSARRDLLTELSRDQDSAAKALEQAEFVDEKDSVRFAFTADQVEAARKEMESSLVDPGRNSEIYIPPEPEKTARLTIELKNRSIDIPNGPLATYQELLLAKRGIERGYPELLGMLPADHPWRAGKATHSLLASSGATDVFGDMRQRMKEENYLLLLLIAGSHDLGRPLQIQRKNDLAYAGQHHGHFSVELLERWQALQQFRPDTQEIIRHGLIHHADMATPELAQPADDQAKIEYVMTAALRDLDKVAVFKGKTDLYLFDQVEKAKQNSLGNFKGEQKTIDPPEVLEGFINRQYIDRKLCRSYEAYMLQFLAWIFDLNFKNTLRAVERTGTIDKLLGYFRQQLPANQFDKIKRTVTAYLAEQLVDKNN